MFLISSDEETLTGLRLAGIEGSLIKTEKDFSENCEAVLEDKEIGVLLITRTLSERFEKEVIELKKSGKILITEVPDINSKGQKSNSIAGYVHDAVGIIV